MKEVSLSGSVRTSVGKKDAKAVRNAGNVPCIIYGGGTQTSLAIKHTDLEKVIVTPNVYILNIDADGKSSKTIIQEVQFHPVTERIMHVDFLELDDKKKIKIDIPVKFSGRSVGVLNGGRLQKVFRKLRVYAYPGDLPDALEVDITDIKIGGMVRVEELATDKLEMLNPANAVVVGVKMARGASEEEEAEELAAAEAAAAAAEGGEGGEGAAEGGEGESKEGAAE